MDDANYYEGRVLNVSNSDWDEDTIYTNSSTSMKTISSSGPMTIPHGESGSRPSTVP